LLNNPVARGAFNTAATAADRKKEAKQKEAKQLAAAVAELALPFV
jgi:hypothetical protein